MKAGLKKLRDKIAAHNQKIYDRTPANKPIDFSKTKKNWGTDVIPERFWLDITKTFKTRGGKRVIHLHKVLHNSCGDEVTFPIKGTVILRESPLKTSYCIWTLTGDSSVVGGETEFDLVESEISKNNPYDILVT